MKALSIFIALIAINLTATAEVVLVTERMVVYFDLSPGTKAEQDQKCQNIALAINNAESTSPRAADHDYVKAKVVGNLCEITNPYYFTAR